MDTVLILEDDQALAEELTETLIESGFKAHFVTTIDRFWRYLSTHETSLFVIDLNLPDGSGVDVVRRLRSESDVGIIITSGMTQEAERVAGIEVGADEYFTKPYSGRELVARARRLTTRTSGLQYSGRAILMEKSDCYIFEGYTLESGSMSLTNPSGDEVPLTTLEYLLLAALVSKPRRVLSREALMDLTHTANWHGSNRNIDNLISRLRKKIPLEGNALLIKTVRGIGYMYPSESHRVSKS